MKPEEFIKAYESALATQDWEQVEPLISQEATVTFSDGSVHHGKNKIKVAFESNFEKIKSEKYSIRNVKWLKKEKSFSVFLFEFFWSGLVDGKLISGNGIGTSVLIKEGQLWKLLAEHLGKTYRS